MISYFVHSTSEDNEASVSSGWSDSPLSKTGVQQASELKRLVKDQHFDCVFSSDLRRAVQTTEIAFSNFRVEVDARLREMNYGLLNGKPTASFPNDPYWCIENRFEQGECCLDVQARIERFLSEHYEPSMHIAVVAHKYPQLAFDVICNGMSWKHAVDRDWRKMGAWQAGWHYELGS